MRYDVIVIGAGVCGAMIARGLSGLKLKTALLEKAPDVAMGASKANSGIVHGGFDALPGTLKAELNVRGTALMKDVCRDLDVPFKNCGSLVVAFSEEDKATLEELAERGRKNGVPGVSIIGADKLRELEPNVAPEAVGALFCESSGIVCPYELTIGAAENAVKNGVDLKLGCKVTAIEATEDGFVVTTSTGAFECSYIVNAAGVYADEIARMVGDDSFRIIPRRGEYYLLDRTVGSLVSRTIFQCPNKMGKGVLVTPTVDGNLLVGPTSVDLTEGREDVSTTLEGLDKVARLGGRSVPKASVRDAITSFAGVRAHPDSNDFIIGVSEANPRFINAAGIESPGLSAAPAIAERVTEIVEELTGAQKNESFDPVREPVFRFRHATDAERAEAIEKNPAYGRIVCRCESVTEGEIIDAIKAGATDIDGVKRRTRAGMGRCQGGFCGSKVAELLAELAGAELNTVTKFGGESKLLYERTK
ncbi:MAG: NAD(P)/FAD-dependent oxidoreductase [Clostridia bacterium]|nr:NAD(P)/FAD-dependent oxidoreductase [Clostridia bacterium]